MSVLIGHARGGDPTYTAGDQSGGEVRTQAWYDCGWNFALRPKDAGIAQKMVTAMWAACKNEQIGYSQARRNDIRAAAIKTGWNISQIKKPADCDCSSLVSFCAEAAGVPIDRPYGNYPYTGNMQTLFMKTGKFELLRDKKYLRSPDYNLLGDILVVHRETGDKRQHTAMVLTDGDLAKPHTHEATAAEEKTENGIVYTVVPGDTLWGIAIAHKTTVTALCKANGIEAGKYIYPGQKLTIPA